jgi:NADPH:quinone reductase-like Zn-dependent oxidoreductase
MQALVLDTPRKTAVIQTIPIPTPGPNELLIKVITVALNPVDALYTANPLGASGRTVGSDFTGIVSGRGSNAHHIKLSQRVAGFLQGACSVNNRPGAFAEYLVVPYDLVWLVPDDMSLNEAATISLCGLTAAQALFGRLGLTPPFQVDGREELEKIENKRVQEVEVAEKEPLKFFIYGASTSVGLYTAQLVHLSSKVSGTPISLYGTASSRHHQMLSKVSYSYDGLVDYKEDDWPAQITKLSGGKGIDLAFDCISEGNSVNLVASTLSAKGKIAVVRSREGGAWTEDERTRDSDPLYGAVWAGLGERVEYQGMTVPALPEARDFAVEFYKYLSDSPLLPNPVRLMPGGLKRIVEDGFELLGTGTMGQRAVDRKEMWMKPVSGEKLVYEVQTDHGN